MNQNEKPRDPVERISGAEDEGCNDTQKRMDQVFQAGCDFALRVFSGGAKNEKEIEALANVLHFLDCYSARS